MTNEQAVAIGVRGVGLWLLVLSVPVALRFIPMALSATSVFTLIVYPFVWLVVRGYLTWRPLTVAQFLLPSQPPEDRNTTWSLDESQAVLFSVLGAYFLISGLADSSAWRRILIGGGSFYYLTTIFSVVLKLGFGLWLLTGAKGLREATKTLRSL